MSGEITIVNVRPRPVAGVRVTTTLSQWPRQFMNPLNKVYDAVRTGNVRQTGQNIMIYRPRKDGQVDIECGVETAGEFAPTGEVVYCETPSGIAATITHIGPYHLLRASHDSVVDWTRKNGRDLARICWEIYGDWDENPAKLRTDIFHLLRP